MNKIERIIKTRKYLFNSDYKNYVDHLERALENIELYKKFRDEKKEYLEKSKIYKDEKSLEYTLEQYKRWKYELYVAELVPEFVRPNNEEDILYRKTIAKEYAKTLKEIVGDNVDLRFHGTEIYLAREIIRSKSISSSADRFDGYMASTDEENRISASTIDSLDRTLLFFSGLGSYIANQPAGVVFAMHPKFGDEELTHWDQMQSVNFDENPEQLYAVITTPENIDMVREWMIEANMDESLVCTYDEFKEKITKDYGNSKTI